MLFSPDEARDAIERMFPVPCYVVDLDACDEYESGLVKEANRRLIAKYRLLYAPPVRGRSGLDPLINGIEVKINTLSGLQMPATEAEAAIARVFPGCTATTGDGDHEEEVGVVQDAMEQTVASYRYLFDEHVTINEIPVIQEIYIGQVGQYYGTREEMHAYEQEQPIDCDFD
jgi:hypothetical protein